MGSKRIVNLPTAAGSAIAASTAFSAHTITVDMPVGPRYHAIYIKCLNPGTGKVGTDLLGEIRIKVNGKVQRVFTADELNKINILNGFEWACTGFATAATEFTLPIWFAEPWRKSTEAQQGLAWSTGDVSTFQLEVDIKAYASTAAVTGLTFQAEIDDSYITVDGKSIPQPMGVITKWFNFQLPIVAASSWHDFTGFPKRGFYQSMHLVDANLDEFEIKLDNSIYYQDTVTSNNAKLKQRQMLPNPSATITPYGVAADLPTRGMVDIVLDRDDRLDSALAMVYPNGRPVQDFNLRVKSGASGTVSRNVKAIVQVAGAAE